MLLKFRVLSNNNFFYFRLKRLTVAGVMSPVHNDYKKHKKSLIDYSHRRAMVELATQNTWIKCSTWEGKQNTWTPTRPVGKKHELNSESWLNWNRDRFQFHEPQNYSSQLIC